MFICALYLILDDSLVTYKPNFSFFFFSVYV